MSDAVSLRGATTLSRSGNAFAVLAVVWIFASFVVADYVSDLFVSRELRPRWLSLSFVAIALLPGAVVLFAGGRVGRLRGFRWLLAWPQPAATVDDDGIELCLPGRGCQRYRWEEVGGLAPARVTRRDRLTSTVPYPRFELRAPDGTILATLPFSLAVPSKSSQGSWLRGNATLAELVVGRRPTRYGHLRSPTLMASFTSYALTADAPPQWENEAHARSLRTRRRLLVGVLFALSIAGFVFVWAPWARP
jgi:hypothetical protein